MEQELECDDATGHHILEGEHSVPILIKGAATDASDTGCLIYSAGFSNLQKTLCLRNLQKNLGKCGCFYDKVLRDRCHDTFLLYLWKFLIRL
jgi:hypothetical protein